jgi:hypothetical protein
LKGTQILAGGAKTLQVVGIRVAGGTPIAATGAPLPKEPDMHGPTAPFTTAAPAPCPRTRWRRPGAATALALAALLAPLVALAQPHAVRHGIFTLRSSVVASQSLPAATLRRHGIAADAHTAVLDAVVLRAVGKAEWPIAAALTATRTTLAGVQRTIALHPVSFRGRVSYVGTFRFVPDEVLDFQLSARIDPASPLLRLSFRERMPAAAQPAPVR